MMQVRTLEFDIDSTLHLVYIADSIIFGLGQVTLYGIGSPWFFLVRGVFLTCWGLIDECLLYNYSFDQRGKVQEKENPVYLDDSADTRYYSKYLWTRFQVGPSAILSTIFLAASRSSGEKNSKYCLPAKNGGMAPTGDSSRKSKILSVVALKRIS